MPTPLIPHQLLQLLLPWCMGAALVLILPLLGSQREQSGGGGGHGNGRHPSKEQCVHSRLRVGESCSIGAGEAWLMHRTSVQTACHAVQDSGRLMSGTGANNSLRAPWVPTESGRVMATGYLKGRLLGRVQSWYSFDLLLRLPFEGYPMGWCVPCGAVGTNVKADNTKKKQGSCA